MKTCIKCGFSCANGCLFVTVNGKLLCKKCAGAAQREVLAEINYTQKELEQKAIEKWQNLKPGGTVIVNNYASLKHAMRRYADANNLAIQTLPDNKAMFQKSLRPTKYGQIAVQNHAHGIGDSITAFYACCGIADAGFEVHFYDVHTDWLARAFYPNVFIHDAAFVPVPDNAIDLNVRYNEQIQQSSCRKQWYCDNFKLAKGISEFDVLPVAPDVNLDIRNKRNGQDYVVIAPCSNDSARFWDKSKWAEVAGLLKEKGLSCVAIGNSDQADLMADIFKPCGNVDHLHNASPDEIANLMLQSRGFIGLDSGMTHYAGLLGINAVGISVQFPTSLLWGMTSINGYRADVTAMEIVEAIL